VSLKTVQLYNGWGFSAANSSVYISVEDDGDRRFHNRNSSLQLITFITDNSEIQIDYNNQSNINTSGILSTNFFDKQKTQTISVSESLISNINLGNDQNYWSLKFTLNKISSDDKDIITNQVFSEVNNELYDLALAWSISEDSFLTAKVFQVNGNATQEQGANLSTITSTFIGFKTRYLGSSLLSIDVGNSKVEKGQNTFSWLINHKTELTDYLTINLGNGRRFSVSDDFRFNTNLQTKTNLNFSLQPNSYLSIALDGSYIEGVIGESINSQTLSLKNTYTLNYKENWNSQIYVQYDKYTDQRHQYDYKQTKVGIRLSRDLI
jgi:hypothetical protein